MVQAGAMSKADQPWGERSSHLDSLPVQGLLMFNLEKWILAPELDDMYVMCIHHARYPFPLVAGRAI
jgi:hypothetical protein